MSTRKKFTRNEMKAFLNILKDELKVEYNTRDITSLDGCKQSLKEIVDTYAYDKFMSCYDRVRSKEIFLDTQIEELKKKKANKKWWKFWE